MIASDDFLRGGDDGPAVEVDPDPAMDDRYRLLGDYRRRALLHLLAESDVPVHHLTTFVTRLVQLEGNGADSMAAEIEVELRHKHLPQLADMDVIEYDERSGVVVYSGDERVETLLEPAREYEVRDG